MRILAINLMPFLGDLLFVTPVFHVLRHSFPDATIDALVENSVREVVSGNPHLSRVITVDKRGRDSGLIGHLRLIKSIRRAKYDLVLNLNGSERTTLIAACSGGKKIRGFAAQGPFSLLYPSVKRNEHIHRAESYLNALAEIGLPVGIRPGLEMYPDRASEDAVEAIWREQKLADRTVIGIHPGAGWPSKRWTLTGLAQLTDMLLEQGLQVVIMGGPGDVGLVNTLITLVTRKPVVLTGRLGLLELAAAIRRCSVFVSADSGPLHVAASQQVPSVALFGPTDPDRYGPYKVRRVIVRALDGCVGSISVEEVFAAVQELLQ